MMKRKRNLSVMKAVVVMLILTGMLTLGAVSIYASDDTNEPIVTATPTPVQPLPTATPKNGLMKEGRIYRYYVNNKPVRNKWKKVKGKYYWFKANGVAAHAGHYKINGVFYVFNYK